MHHCILQKRYLSKTNGVNISPKNENFTLQTKILFVKTPVTAGKTRFWLVLWRFLLHLVNFTSCLNYFSRIWLILKPGFVLKITPKRENFRPK